MPHANPNRSKRLDPRLPLVLDTRTLGPGAARSVTITASAPANLGVELVGVPEGAELELDVELERVTEGVLVTGTVRAPLVGECARCLDMFASATEVRFTELFTHEAGDDDADGYLLDGDLLDLEPALRDALVLELPLAPLCAEDCPGLCSECGVRLADREPDTATPMQAQIRHRTGRPCRRQGRSADVAVPKRRMSRSNTRSRRAQWKTTAPQLVTCPQCRDPKLPHTACPTCGTYNRRQVINPS